METDSPVVYHGTTESRFPPEQIKKTQIQLSTEEIRVLRECNRESFYYRCLPFAVAGMTATFFAIRHGYLKGHQRWGPAGKMSAAAALGWFMGKFSYRSVCEDKFLKLENSAVGNAIRKKRGYVSETFDTEKLPEEEFGSPDSKYTSYTTDDYHSSSGSLNLDVDKNISYSGLDDRERPSTDNETLNVEDGVQPIRTATTYEELRRRNREQYERQQNRQSQVNQESSQTGGVQRPWNRNEPPKRYTSGQSDGTKKNAYGDVWEP
ncbi:OCIA domain-containing protein 1 [Araneus ventricosus]|uniref:OCIA domain-containing protein 1 n=1 Tax=Araneus ventricosus TaxID=182803 RepID=A0A4Y2JBR1_ARAVE|nr:OCIA domain-containing protein 1 [Araneus ventricosus]